MSMQTIDLRKRPQKSRKASPQQRAPRASLVSFPAMPLLETEEAAHPEIRAETDADELEPLTLFSWEAPEFERDALGGMLSLGIAALFAAGGILTLVLQNFPLAALLFLSAGFLGWHAYRKPRQCIASITSHGVRASGREYDFETLRSFWIFEEPNLPKELSLRQRRTSMHNICIPLGDADLLRLREILVRFLREEKEERTLTDILIKRLGF